jgi:hypothetical protein
LRGTASASAALSRRCGRRRVPPLPRPPHPGDSSRRRRVQERDTTPVLERNATRGHSRDLHPSSPKRDGGLVHHTVVRGFAKIPAATTLFRRGTGGLVRLATLRGTSEAFSRRGTGCRVRRVTARGTAMAFSAGPSGRMIPVSIGTCPLSRDEEVWPTLQSVPQHRKVYGRGLLHHPVRERDSGVDAREARAAPTVVNRDGRGRLRAHTHLLTPNARTRAPLPVFH